MGRLLMNKRNVLTTLVGLGAITAIILIITGYFFVRHQLTMFEEQKTAIAGDTAEMLYSQERDVLRDIEPELNDFMSYSLKQSEQELKQLDEVTRQDLINIAEDIGVTGAWLIEEDRWIRISTDGIERDTRNMYWSETDASWEKTFDRLIDNPGEEYIAGFTKMHIYDDYPYYKLGYRGLGPIGNLGPVVLEIGISTSDIKEDQAKLQERFNLSLLNENVNSIEFIREAEESDSSFREETIKTEDGWRTYKIVEDFNEQKTQIIIDTSFPFTENLKQGLLMVVILSKIMIAAIGGTMVYFIRSNL